MIYRDCIIAISKSSSTINEPIVLYRGDREVELYFTIKESQYKFTNTENLISTTNASYAQIIIKVPNNNFPIFGEILPTKEGKALLKITSTMIDEIDEVGLYDFQIRLYDENKTSRVTIPPIEKGIEVREPIAIEDVTVSNEVGVASVGYSQVGTKAIQRPTLKEDGSYNKKIWVDSETITKEDLNVLEDIADKNTSEIDLLKTSGGNTSLNTIVLTTEQISEILGNSEIKATSITLSLNYISMNVGETRTLTYTIVPTNTTNRNVTFKSSNTDVATVDSNGLITAIAKGDILITATTSNGISTDCQIVISEVSNVIDLTNITLNKSNISLNKDDTYTLIPTFIPSDATNKSVEWSSDNIAIATVSNNGIVTAIGKGTCIITCKSVGYPSIQSQCSVNVTEIVQLTSITDGLVHSYDFKNLSGTSTTIEDLTGNVPMTITGFTDVSSAKTSKGIVADNNAGRLVQGNMSTAIGGKYSVVIMVTGANALDAGYWGTSGIKLTNHSGKSNYDYTDGAYLSAGFYPITHSLYSYEIICTTFDFANSTIKTYINGKLINTVTMNAKVIWNNTLNIFDGYAVANNKGLCMNCCLLYDKVITDSEALTIFNDLTGGNRYIGLDKQSTSLNNINNVLQDYSSANSTYSNNTLKSLVYNESISNVNSVISNGFTVSDYTSIPISFYNNINSYIIVFNYDNTSLIASAENYILYDTADIGFRVFIQNNKLYMRSSTIWFIDGSASVSNGLHSLIINNVSYLQNSNIIPEIYFDGIKKTIADNRIYHFIDMLYNTKIPVKNFIMVDRKLTEEEITQIHTNLGGN